MRRCKTAIVIHDAAKGRTQTIANAPPALSDIAASFGPTCFVVCEATGGYERDLLAALVVAGVPACRADAPKVKAFIRSFDTLGKSDAIDAAALARYGQDRYAALPLWNAREPKRERLQALVLARRDLVKDRLAERSMNATPHVAQNTSSRSSAIDGRATQHPGMGSANAFASGSRKPPAGSRRSRAMSEPSSVAGARGRTVTFAAAAYNLARLPKLLEDRA